jgi:muramoyltetrapeptide carboxypeptidase
VIELLGFRPVFSETIFAEDLYFAGSHSARASELKRMFADPTIKAIVCARGGYGTNHLLPLIDLEIVRRNPKIFVGYSDVTTLLTYFADAAGLVSFHGPMVTKDFARSGGVDLDSWRRVLSGEACIFGVSDASVLREGEAEGVLYGGCLSMLVASLGTPYEIRTEGTLLFVEDVATKPFQIDRMLMHLKYAGKLDGVRGLIFGEMLDCFQSPGQGYSLQDVIVRTLSRLQVPIVFGFRSGHVSTANLTLPLGVRARLVASSGGVTLETLEPATAD